MKHQNSHHTDMKRFRPLLQYTCLVLFIIIGLRATAQNPVVTTDGNGNAVSVTNTRDEAIKIMVHLSGGTTNHIPVGPHETQGVSPDCDWMKLIKNDGSHGPKFWKKKPVAAPEAVNDVSAEKPSNEDVKPEKPSNENVKLENKSAENVVSILKQKPDIIDVPVDIVGRRNKSDILQDFISFLESTDYYSSSLIALEREGIEQFIAELQGGADRHFVGTACPDTIVMTNNLNGNRQNIDHLITQFLKRYTNSDREKESLKNDMAGMLNERLNKHEENLNQLKSALDTWEQNQSKHNWPLISLITAIVTILAGLISWFIGRKKSSESLLMPTPIHGSQKSRKPVADKEIVVRRKTTSILKKQSLENVIDNPCYLAIDSADFCTSSAVRRIYIKNTCIKDIYNMYAEDLRNPENPKEDGCMVLGRWVHDKEKNEYYVSLEDVVKPGDDAVFSEYELNFGGKIKLKVSEKLRKLRRETDLQYDMTCWVHSHPGLGVFFSNQDNTVHMQLKHPTHPHFLTALVIDILTPEQELGIFTFKPDGTLNSKADLTQMYSLEDMYKWAIESERNTFKREDYFDTLAHAKQHESSCHGVHLSNSAIIDIGKLAVEHENGMAGMVHGFIQQEGNFSEIAVSAVCQEERIPDNEPVGCFIITKYCSIPTVRKAIDPHAGNIRFAVVYSTADGLLTTIPLRGGELVANEAYYGEQKLEDLKIWTRRKR